MGSNSISNALHQIHPAPSSGPSAVAPNTHQSPDISTAQSVSPGNDHAALSHAAVLIARAGDNDGVRTERVNAISSSIAAGTYHVSPSAVATKLVDYMLP